MPDIGDILADSPPPTGLMGDWSLEAPAPGPGEIAAIAGRLPPGTEIYLTALARIVPPQHVEAARRIAAAGLRPVPHIAARRIESRAALADHLARLREAGVEKALVIGGDLDAARGPYSSSRAVIESGLLQEHGIGAIGIAGYPEGHPRIADDVLARDLLAKIAAARAGGLQVHVVTQFCFDAGPILKWHRALRGEGVDVPVRFGMAGPASVETMLRIAVKCGVNFPLRKFGLAARLFRGATPDRIVEQVDNGIADPAARAAAAFHLFAFGGLTRAIDWLDTVAGRRAA